MINLDVVIARYYGVVAYRYNEMHILMMMYNSAFYNTVWYYEYREAYIADAN